MNTFKIKTCHCSLRCAVQALRISPGLYSTFFGVELATEDHVPAFMDTFWVIFQTLSSLQVWLGIWLALVLSLLPYLGIVAVMPHAAKIWQDFRGTRVYQVKPTIVTYVNQAFQKD